MTIVPVRVLQRFDDTVYVTGGLREGQEVVLSGIQFATEGTQGADCRFPGPLNPQGAVTPGAWFDRLQYRSAGVGRSRNSRVRMPVNPHE